MFVPAITDYSIQFFTFSVPVIACKPTFPPYLACLLPTDQVFDFDELEYHFQVANRTEDLPAEKKGRNFKCTQQLLVYRSRHEPRTKSVISEY